VERAGIARLCAQRIHYQRKELAMSQLEVFYRMATAIQIDDWRDEDGNLLDAGWYYWFCSPGCLPDSDPIGPFRTSDDALQDAKRFED